MATISYAKQTTKQTTKELRVSISVTLPCNFISAKVDFRKLILILGWPSTKTFSEILQRENMHKYFKIDTLDSLSCETLDQNRPHLLFILEKLSRKREEVREQCN